MKNKILIIKLGALGDVINTLPLAVRLVESFNAEITWIVESLSFPILNNHDFVSKVLLFDKKNKKKSFKKIKKIIKSENYDYVLDLQRILKSAYFTLNASGKRKISFDKKRCKELTWIFPFEKIGSNDHESSHMLDQYMEFADYLGLENFDKIKWEIPVFDTSVKITGPYAVLNTGATKPANKWFEDYFAELCDLIYEKTKFTPVLTGGSEDAEFSENIAALTQKKPVNLTCRTTLSDLTEILRGASHIISCDTGPMHLGVALGKKVCALFGPSNPVRTGPYYGKIIQSRADCTKCNKKHCRTRDCMREIKPEKVFNAVFLGEWQEMKADYI